MPRTTIIASVVGALSVAGCLLPAAATAARADDCSGILCMFSSKPAAPPAAQPAPQPAAAAQPATTAPEQATVDAADPAPKARKSRPVPVVTIAAGPTEVVRLKALAAVMQKPRVRIVEARDSAPAADFAVTTTLDPDHSAEKARLFTEEMHILAGAKIRSMADLKGKVVSFGADHSPGQAAARKAFETLGIQVAETPLDLDNALDGLATGDLDAVVVLAPQPDRRLAKVAAPGLHLVAWPNDAAPPDGTVAATIDAGAYPGLARPGDKVAALGVDAVLTLQRKGERQPAAKAFLGALSQHSAALSKRGFDLIKADLDQRSGSRVANVDAR